MTILFYKVDQFFTKSKDEAKIVSDKLGCRVVSVYAEYPHVDDLDIISKITIEELKERFYKNDVKFF